MGTGMIHRHRDVQGGAARAAVFGISDGLVSNVALILGIAGASTDPTLVRVAGVSGLLAGAISMAAGEYVSLRAQAELVERELDIERRSIAENPEAETAELAAIYRERGLDPDHAKQVAEGLMADPEVALDVHAREELGVNPTQLGNPMVAAASSFGSFALGAFVPLVPWLGGGGNNAVWASVILGLSVAALVGAVLARLTERSVVRTVARQLLVVGGACGATYLIGTALGTSVA
ncbi:MAG: VIT1/CCC1 transporter family protein [Acidimicrobiales bacterium]|nr:VIT1/CCC1 transporter family protein [Acidimicrobiales bacterium]